MCRGFRPRSPSARPCLIGLWHCCGRMRWLTQRSAWAATADTGAAGRGDESPRWDLVPLIPDPLLGNLKPALRRRSRSPGSRATPPDTPDRPPMALHPPGSRSGTSLLYRGRKETPAGGRTPGNGLLTGTRRAAMATIGLGTSESGDRSDGWTATVFPQATASKGKTPIDRWGWLGGFGPTTLRP